MNPYNFSKISKLILQKNKILLMSHKDGNSDGDAIGSLLALAMSLQKLGKTAIPVLEKKPKETFNFLPHLKKIKNFCPKDVDLVILVDFATKKRASFPKDLEHFLGQKIPVIVIDHHPKEDLAKLADLKMIDTTASAACEMLYFLILDLGIKIDKDIALALLAGIFTDTYSFQNPNTTRRTLEVSSALLAAGARLKKITDNIVYEKSLKETRLLSRAIERLFENREYNILITFLTEDDLREFGVSSEDASGIANFLNSVSGISVVLFLLEENGVINGSLRTRKDNVNVARLAKFLGGGGHRKASGFEITGKIVSKNGKIRIE